MEGLTPLRILVLGRDSALRFNGIRGSEFPYKAIIHISWGNRMRRGKSYPQARGEDLRQLALGLPDTAKIERKSLRSDSRTWYVDSLAKRFDLTDDFVISRNIHVDSTYPLPYNVPRNFKSKTPVFTMIYQDEFQRMTLEIAAGPHAGTTLKIWNVCLANVKFDNGEIGITQSEISDIANITRPQVSRSFRLLLKYGALFKDGEGRRTIYICNPFVGWCGEETRAQLEARFDKTMIDSAVQQLLQYPLPSPADRA